MPWGMLLTRRTLFIMGSAFVIALFFAWPREYHGFLLYIPYRLLGMGDTLFHEMGHAMFHWLFGRPAVPGIMTLFGSNLAAGYTFYFAHNWTFQILVWAAFIYGCRWLHRRRPTMFLPAVAACVLCVILSFTGYPVDLIGIYMGHGGSIFCGGVLLYRAWLNIIVKTPGERWFNALFGFFILLYNGFFAYQLAFSEDFKSDYENHELTEDFTQMVDIMHHWSIAGIASFTLAYAALTLILSFVLAAYFYEDEHYAGV